MSLGRRSFFTAGALAAPALTLSTTATAAAPGQQGTVPVRTGADLLAADRWQALAGRKVGVLANPTGALTNLSHIVDDMVEAGHRPLAAFGPEHGFRGTAQAGGSEGDYKDPRTGISVYDAYGASVDKLAGYFRKAGIDTLVFDIASVGARFYTYIWSMYTAMRAAVRTGASFVVLDRPNPIGGEAFGPMLDPAFASGVGLKPITQQPGMTVAELAKLFDTRFLPEDEGRGLAKLEIHRCRGWRRDRFFAETGQPWIMPSPNMPTADTALVYPGTCMFEGTNLTTGRGTTRPFEIIGAPGIDWRWAQALNALDLPGVRFAETYFVPTFSDFAGKTCGGVALHVHQPHRFDPIRTGVAMLVTAKRGYPSLFGWRKDNWIDKLTGSARLRTMLDKGADTEDIVGAWQPELEKFRRTRRPFLLYS
ncbi:exo-beta-N-acetylmuramidase NamZ family protein [Sciscionella sediminilitoris]|uniref:exo-beta-N-acetylmuramidase NamZ family protein n=1 Tax=Sciscionella sediminilitoris TaxID=1445613 RepID=UPI0004DF6D4E|nr:DUF1343 domain-containing protein [Sciscionella sp. SE31]